MLPLVPAHLLSVLPAFEPDIQAVEVYRTNVTTAKQAAVVLNALAQACPELTGSFDLDDCDRILCLRCHRPGPACWDQAVAVVRSLEIEIEALPD